MKKRKIAALLLFGLLGFGVLSACSNESYEEDVAISVMLVDGAPLLRTCIQ